MSHLAMSAAWRNEAEHNRYSQSAGKYKEKRRGDDPHLECNAEKTAMKAQRHQSNQLMTIIKTGETALRK